MQGEEIFQTIPDKHDSVKEAVEEAKKTSKVGAQNSLEILLPLPTHLFFHPKSFPKNFSRQNELCYSGNARQKKNEARKVKGEERRRKEIVKTAVSLLNSSKLFFLHMPKLMRRQSSAGPVKGFVVCFISL